MLLRVVDVVLCNHRLTFFSVIFLESFVEDKEYCINVTCVDKLWEVIRRCLYEAADWLRTNGYWNLILPSHRYWRTSGVYMCCGLYSSLITEWVSGYMQWLKRGGDQHKKFQQCRRIINLWCCGQVCTRNFCARWCSGRVRSHVVLNWWSAQNGFYAYGSDTRNKHRVYKINGLPLIRSHLLKQRQFIQCVWCHVEVEIIHISVCLSFCICCLSDTYIYCCGKFLSITSATWQLSLLRLCNLCHYW